MQCDAASATSIQKQVNHTPSPSLPQVAAVVHQTIPSPAMCDTMLPHTTTDLRQPSGSLYCTTFLHHSAVQLTINRTPPNPSISLSPTAVEHKKWAVHRDTQINGRGQTVISRPAPDGPPLPSPPAFVIAYWICELWLAKLNWTWNYGPENLWEAEFEFCLGVAQSKGKQWLDTFFKRIAEHTRRGWYILKKLWSIGTGLHDDYGNFIDLFLQGMELVMDITSEVKFFKVKIGELATHLKVGFLRELVEETEEESDSSNELDSESGWNRNILLSYGLLLSLCSIIHFVMCLSIFFCISLYLFHLA